LNQNIDILLNHEKYHVTKEDLDFLYSGDARGLRLQIDYQKAESKMKQAGIEHTIVVFGSSKITENNNIMNAYSEARKLGQLVGKSGDGVKDCRVTIMTGGGPGIMEAANRGANDVGAKSIGLNIKLPNEQYPNPYITPELLFKFFYFGTRKLHFMQRAKALVVFPGGFGTLDELFEGLTLVQTYKKESIPIVLVNSSFWKNTINFDYLIEQGVIVKKNIELFYYAKDADDAWNIILKWYSDKNYPLFDN